MAAYRRVYDSHHLQADCMPRTWISSGTLRSVIEYGLRLHLRFYLLCDYSKRLVQPVVETIAKCKRGGL